MKFKFFSLILVVLGMGLTACSSDKSNDADNAAEMEAAITETTDAAVAYKVMTESSTINWTASKPGKDHSGAFTLNSGEIIVAGNSIVGGNFEIDMANLKALNADGTQNAYLEGHLKGSSDSNKDDFFNVSAYPTANFAITKVTEYKAEGDEANCVVYGNLTIKEITKPVNFKATSKIENGVLSAKSSAFTINRTDWGINYDSGSVIKDLVAEKIIVDEVPISIQIMASK